MLRSRIAARDEWCGRFEENLKQVLERYRNGSLRVCMAYTGAKAQADFDLGEDWKVRPDDALISDPGKWLEPENVQVVYQ